MSVTTDINYWVITLKRYVSCFVGNLTLQEKYGEKDCECSWESFILANNLIDIMQCYTVLSYVSGPVGQLGDSPTIPSTTITLHDNCFTDANEAEIQRIFGLASNIVNSAIIQ